MELVAFALSVCLGCSALSDGWLLVIVCRHQCTVWASSSLSELMATGSAAIEPWDQYIKPIEDADKETLPMFVPDIVWTFISASLWFFFQNYMSVFVNISIIGLYICDFVSVLQVDSLLTQTNEEARPLLMPAFPRQRLPGRDSKSLPFCFSAFSPSIPSILSIQSAAVAVCGIN